MSFKSQPLFTWKNKAEKVLIISREQMATKKYLDVGKKQKKWTETTTGALG